MNPCRARENIGVCSIQGEGGVSLKIFQGFPCFWAFLPGGGELGEGVGFGREF